MGEWLPDGPVIPEGPVVDGPVVDGPVYRGPDFREAVLDVVVNWLVGGLWDATLAVVAWILQLFDVALIDPAQSAGRGIMDAFAPVGDALIDLAWAVSDPMREVAASSPFGLVVVSFLAGVVLVGVAYLARGALLSLKTVTWK
ncbi:hypothetical protein [Halobacterium wangiae]|uniref:hypothetical protein n=1 Tax=Halobacterium wangiae TaxID=2902623 RepID=UPI001E346198|nr:hypothetical protein [Halobacterium wangiae]